MNERDADARIIRVRSLALRALRAVREWSFDIFPNGRDQIFDDPVISIAKQ